MVTARRLGSTTQASKDSSTRPKSMDKESMFGQMVQAIMESGLIIISKDRENINGSMAVFTLVNGKTTLCTAMVFTPGKMVEDMRASILRTKSMGSDFIIGPTVAYMRVNG
jgi:hypothetical protein